MEGTVKWMWMLSDTQWKNQLLIDRLRTEQREDRGGCLQTARSKSVYGAHHKNAASRLELMPYPE